MPIAAPSANLSGRPSGTTGSDVLHDLQGRVKCVLDAGPTMAGLESTVVDIHRRPPAILRPGAVTLEMLAPFFPDISLYSGDENVESGAVPPPTPGLKYRHYTPENAHVVLFELHSNGAVDSTAGINGNGTYESHLAAMQQRIFERLRALLAANKRVAVLHVHKGISYDAFADKLVLWYVACVVLAFDFILTALLR